MEAEQASNAATHNQGRSHRLAKWKQIRLSDSPESDDILIFIPHNYSFSLLLGHGKEVFEDATHPSAQLRVKAVEEVLRIGLGTLGSASTPLLFKVVAH